MSDTWVFGYGSLVSLPLEVNGRRFCVLTVFADSTGAFDEEVVELLQELAGDMVYALGALETAALAKEAELAHRDSEERSARSVAGDRSELRRDRLMHDRARVGCVRRHDPGAQDPQPERAAHDAAEEPVLLADHLRERPDDEAAHRRAHLEEHRQ